MDTVFQLLAGGLLTVSGFVTKYLVDYYYLKSPKLKVEVVIKSTGNHPPSNGYRIYNYEILLSIYNLSDNVAYGFDIDVFKIDDSFFKTFDRPDVPSLKEPLKADKPILLSLSYHANLPISSEFKYDDGRGQLRLLDKTFHIKYHYANSLGKYYSKTLHDNMLIYGEKPVF